MTERTENIKDIAAPSNFIRDIIDEDLRTGKRDRVGTRFPPEPNGYLHIGHAKSICLNFGVARDYQGTCNLRFDDTNPAKEEDEYVQAIKEDVRWLGFAWDELRFASDYFDQLYEWAEQLIQMGLAYVDDLSPEEIREYRGTLKEPGRNSPYRDRPAEENLDLFRRMRAGEFEEGARVLRAKIDMASPNVTLRDPTIYRIKKASHHRTGDKWVIYPMYDYTHCLSDSIEGVTHSLCSLEFKNNRPLYDWFIKKLGVFAPQQIEFARLNLSYTVLSKRRLIQLVQEGHVDGWDDPRMPTISGVRRRGFTPASIRNFCDKIGVAKADSLVDYTLLEHSLREDLNENGPRMMAVVNPVKLVIDNYPDDQTEEFDFPYHPEHKHMGSRKLPFSKELYVEADDYRDEAPRKWFRLAPGKEVRLRYAYYVTCTHAERDDEGNLTEIHCTYDPETRGGWSKDGRKVKGTLHWVSAKHAIDAEIRLYDYLFTRPNPLGEEDFKACINPDSLKTATGKVEPGLADVEPGAHMQFERIGYFCADLKDHSPQKPVFNRTTTLRDTWAKMEQKQEK